MRGVLACIGLLAMLTPTPLRSEPISFTADNLGRLPSTFETALTGGGPPPVWQVVADKTSGSGYALAQLSADKTDYRFPLAIYKSKEARNVSVLVRFKAVAGAVDRAAGVAVRVVDANNYYVVRANALEDNVRFYRVVSGRRKELAGANVKVTAGEWHRLGLRATDDRFTILFNDRELFAIPDRTFANAGRIALWTKADSVTHFDDLVIDDLP
ncbi:hypothetical protein [Terrarubrum flagellatum]|uniref:hypothetical protein n=1 Tax=Terrirubrum flagellatum TaxID=2895980 RepID=UPI0031455759